VRTAYPVRGDEPDGDTSASGKVPAGSTTRRGGIYRKGKDEILAATADSKGEGRGDGEGTCNAEENELSDHGKG